MASALDDLASQLYARAALPAPPDRRALRTAVGASLGDVAQAIGVTRNAVMLWERGERTPRGDNLKAYVAVLRLFRETAPASVAAPPLTVDALPTESVSPASRAQGSRERTSDAEAYHPTDAPLR